MRRPRLLALPTPALAAPALAALVLATVLTACGGDSDGDTGGDSAADPTPTVSSTPTPSTTTPPAPTPSTSAPAPATSSTPSGPSEPTAPSGTPAPSPPAPAETPASDPALRVAAQAYADAFLTGDAPAAFDLLSERCKDTVDMVAFGDEAIAAGQKYGSPQPISSYDAKVAGESATLTYRFTGNAPAHRRQPWVREQGFWHLDEC
ncbi:hypothetical protein [Nocardioides pantholopis]|uniref:hypothetical protein n=1 Tax=Nocardioides pantholopis TaxID=2483798 RepID=UPI000F0817CE|nr:hypothetical protein [Nocardioides pantholopis]